MRITATMDLPKGCYMVTANERHNEFNWIIIYNIDTGSRYKVLDIAVGRNNFTQTGTRLKKYAKKLKIYKKYTKKYSSRT